MNIKQLHISVMRKRRKEQFIAMVWRGLKKDCNSGAYYESWFPSDRWLDSLKVGEKLDSFGITLTVISVTVHRMSPPELGVGILTRFASEFHYASPTTCTTVPTLPGYFD